MIFYSCFGNPHYVIVTIYPLTAIFSKPLWWCTPEKKSMK